MLKFVLIMKKMKRNVMMLLVVALTAVSCSNEEKVSVEEKKVSTFLQKQEDRVSIGRVIDSDNILPLVDLDELSSKLLEEKFLAEIEEIELTERYFTIIGKRIGDFALEAYQIELVRDGDVLYLLGENNSIKADKHTCTAANCSN